MFALAFALPLSVSMSDLVLLSVMGIVQLGVGLLLMMAGPVQAQSAEGREGIAAFLGKRPPVFVPSSLET